MLRSQWLAELTFDISGSSENIRNASRVRSRESGEKEEAIERKEKRCGKRRRKEQVRESGSARGSEREREKKSGVIV